jgi:hypothetical protein
MLIITSKEFQDIRKSPYFFLLFHAAEIIAYPRPTANPNANGIKNTADSRLNA